MFRTLQFYLAAIILMVVHAGAYYVVLSNDFGRGAVRRSGMLGHLAVEVSECVLTPAFWLASVWPWKPDFTWPIMLLLLIAIESYVVIVLCSLGSKLVRSK